MISPTVGRKVWYRPQKSDVTGPLPMSVMAPYNEPAAGQPLDATVIAVHGDRMVNVLVTDAAGRQYPVLSCTLLQPGDEPAHDHEGKLIGRYCEWVPYQQTQAAKSQ